MVCNAAWTMVNNHATVVYYEYTNVFEIKNYF
jgi:hypothetical protein